MTRCPARDELQRLLDEQLAASDRDCVEAHVEECAGCQNTLSELSEASASIVPRQASPPAPLAAALSADVLRRLKQRTRTPLLGVAGGTRTVPPEDSPPSDSARVLPTLPGYEVLEELGRGGMGAVYKARHLALHRLVALKVVLTGAHASPEERARFRREAEAVARLQHPNIVQIHDVGEHDGLPYLALEYVAGDNLAQRLQGTPWPARQAAELIETLSRAVQHAHDHGVIHRDLKPGNILLSGVRSQGSEVRDQGGVPADSCPLTPDPCPKITDFGLAKLLVGERFDPTQSGAILGTPSYMAPEQAAGTGRAVGPAADIYALGAILYECLTGRTPFKAATPLDTLLQVQTEEPVPPSRLQPKLPRDLETICLKCLEKEPARRYPTALALAEDLRNFQDRRPVRARPVGWTGRLSRWCRRNPVVAILLAAVLLVFAAGSLASTVLAVLADRRANEAAEAQSRAEGESENARREAEAKTAALEEVRQQKDRAQKELARAEFVAYAFRLREAQAAIEQGRLEEGRAVLELCDLKLRRWEHDHVFRQTLQLRTELWGNAGPVRRVSFSPDGRRIAAAIQFGWDAQQRKPLPGKVQVWDVQQEREVLSLKGHTGALTSVCYSPDGKRLVSAGDAGEIKVWDAATGKEVLALKGLTDRAWSPCFSPDGGRIAAGSVGTVKVWDAATGKEVRTIQGAGPGVCFSPDGRRLASGFPGTQAKVWDAATGEELLVLTGTPGWSRTWPSATTAGGWPPPASTGRCGSGTQPGARRS
jgi:serine/threonine protein kinase